MNPDIATIKIKNLRLRTFIGFNEEERIKKQDIVINVLMRYDAGNSTQSDAVDDAYNYKVLTKGIIELVENTSYNLLEKMAADILAIIKQEEKIIFAQVEIDKPHALRFADSVSLMLEYKK